MAQCGRIKSDGARCRNTANGLNGLCFAHDPVKAEARKKSAKRAGHAGGRGRPSVELRRLQRTFEELIERLDKGDVVRADAAVMGQLLNGARACVRDLLAAHEQEQLIERMEAIEAELQTRRERDRNRVA